MLLDFLSLYQIAPKLVDLKPQLENQEFLAFSQKKGLPVALCSVVKHLEQLPHVDHLYSFFNRSRIFWLLPCDTPSGRIMGFGLRSFYSKEYRYYFNTNIPQYCFGFASFQQFQYGYPIVLVEGAKDAIFVQQFYPYCLTALTANISESFLTFLSALTNNFIIAFDNNHTGRLRARSLKQHLDATNTLHSRTIHPALNDWGDYFQRSDLTFTARNVILNAVNLFKFDVASLTPLVGAN